MRSRERLPSPISHMLAEVPFLVILALAQIPVAFGTFGSRTTLALLGLVVPPLVVAGIAAVRQPRHCWLLALETWVASLLPQIVAETRFFPSRQPLAVVLVESLLFIVPVAWVTALLGKGLGQVARHGTPAGEKASEPHPPRFPTNRGT